MRALRISIAARQRSCASATKATAVPEIKKFGFAPIVILRKASDADADLEGKAAAKAADRRYYSIPFNSASSDPAAPDKFLDAITAKWSEPVFIHCARGGRAATMRFTKRLVIDYWDVMRASNEATALGMTSLTVKHFAIDYP
ncbi:MAG: hypothetical protein LAO19_19235 [Acidobacteriia bacterium]|nr:hypothetical protein [Terriglobia bacterium]